MPIHWTGMNGSQRLPAGSSRDWARWYHRTPRYWFQKAVDRPAGEHDFPEVLRLPVRDDNADSMQVNRGVPYPDDLFVDGTPDIVGALVYKNADAYWSLAASKGDKRLTIWSATAGTIVPKLAVPVTAPVRLAAFADKGHFAVTVPQFNPEVCELPHYALSVWAIGVEERLHLACLAAGGEMAAADWDRYIGDFTGEAPRATCATR